MNGNLMKNFAIWLKTILMVTALCSFAAPSAFAQTGLVVAWGSNSNGQTTIPAGLSGVTAIAAGSFHTVALKSDGTLVAWGLNSTGQTTIPAGLIEVSAIAAGRQHTVALKSDGTVVAWGSNADGQTTIPAGLIDVTAIAAGDYHTVALKSNGTLVAWGANYSSEATIPSGLSGVTAIAAGASHTVALKNDGTVVAWGYNVEGQTTIPAGLSGVTAIAAAGAYHTVALKSDGTVVAWGDNSSGQRTIPTGLSGVTAIAAGGNHTVALKSNGTVVAWGSNSWGQRTIPTGWSVATAIAAGAAHTVALVTDSTPPVITPSVAGGIYASARSVTLSANETATIYYTLDGTTPTTASAVYSTALGISATTTLKYFGKDTVGNSSAVQTQSYTISTLVIITASLAGGDVGTVYNAALTASGGVLPYTWSAPGLPAGLSINASTGAISGTPTAIGAYGFMATATDAVSAAFNKAFSIVILDATAPTVATGLTASAVSAAQIDLAWAASTDNVGVTAYQVYRGGTLLATLGNVTSYSNTGLRSGTAYSYRVEACDAVWNCSAQSVAAAATTTIDLVLPLLVGWNLIGNGTQVPMNVATTFGAATNVTTVWKWIAASSKWAFYTPLQADGGAAYAATKGYDLLTTLNAGEAFWVNAAAPFTATLNGPTPYSLGTSGLRTGWNLVSTGNVFSPAQLDAKLGGTVSAPSFSTMWAWNANSASWYFYAPSLVANNTLAPYILSKNYLDFGSLSTGNGLGFWLNSNVTAPQFGDLSFSGVSATRVSNEGAKTITLAVPFGTDVTALVATFTTTAASVQVDAALQTSGITANNFASPVLYVVMAADGLRTSYTVTVTFAEQVSKTIGSAGDTLSLPGASAALTVPAGALSTNTVIVMSASTAPVPMPGIPGMTYTFTPAGARFLQPVTITLKYDPATLAAGFSEANLCIGQLLNGVWAITPGMGRCTVDTSAKTVSTTITHFSDYGSIDLVGLASAAQRMLNNSAVISLEDLIDIYNFSALQQANGCVTDCLSLGRIADRTTESLNAKVESHCSADVANPSDAALIRWLERDVFGQQVGADTTAVQGCQERVLEALIRRDGATARSDPSDAHLQRLPDLHSKAQLLGISRLQTLALQELASALRALFDIILVQCRTPAGSTLAQRFAIFEVILAGLDPSIDPELRFALNHYPGGGVSYLHGLHDAACD